MNDDKWLHTCNYYRFIAGHFKTEINVDCVGGRVEIYR